MSHLIEVAFRGNRKEFFQWNGETAPPLKAAVIVEADRGEDFGRVHSTGELAEVRCKGCVHGCGTTPPPRVAVRLATREEMLADKAFDEENETTRRKAMERVKANGLVMKLTDAEWQWDRRKLTIFFTAERRVDFRGLVRDLAALFRTRIELKQIGVRDEAKRLSGIGRCGREYCSASWLPDLRPVNLGVAKDQKLSLNPQQISGACGRLMCCLRYEHEFYVQSRRRFPKEGKILQTKLGEEKVLACDIFNERVTLRTAEGDTRVVALAELREEIGGFGDAIVLEAPAVDRADSMLEIDEMLGDTGEHVASVLVDQTITSDVLTVQSVSVESVVVADSVAGVTHVRGVDAVDSESVNDGAAGSNAVDSVGAEGEEVDREVMPASDETEPRRKRRRGRRGGRRLRAAEQRRSGESPENADDTGDTGDTSQADDDDDEPLTSNNS